LFLVFCRESSVTLLSVYTLAVRRLISGMFKPAMVRGLLLWRSATLGY
jgi:hypothetical protein